MKPLEMVRACVAAMEAAEEFKIEPGLTLVWPKGSGRFPMHGELLCVNASGKRVYRVRVADALSYVSKILKVAYPICAHTRSNPPMTEKPQRQHEPAPNFHNGDDRDEVNALLQRHPSKPGQGSATRADNGVPVSTTEHPAHASSLDPATSGQAASTVTLPGTVEQDDDESGVDTRDERDSAAPPVVTTSSSTPNAPIAPGSAPENAGSPPIEGNVGSPPPAGSTPPPA